MSKPKRCFKGLVKVQSVTKLVPNSQYVDLNTCDIFQYTGQEDFDIKLESIGKIVVESKQVLRDERGVKTDVKVHHWELKHTQWINSASNSEINNPDRFVYFVINMINGISYAKIISNTEKDDINQRRQEHNK